MFTRAWILVLGIWSASLGAQELSGTVVFDVRPFTSEVRLKEKIENQLATGGLEWGVADGQLIVSLINKRFVGVEVPYLTRYGSSQTLELAPGTYRMSCIGYVPEGGLNVEKALSKGAYFNLDVLSFEVRAGETTTIQVQPTIRKESTFFLKMFLPELLVSVVGIDTQRVVNDRTEASIPWDDYTGPLKF